MIDSSGYEHAFLVFGLIQGGIVFVMAWLLLVPPPQLSERRGQTHARRRMAIPRRKY